MNQRELQLALKKQRLQLRSAQLRRTLANNMAGLAPAASIADVGMAGVRWLRGHPQWAVGAATALMVLRPRRTLWLGMRLWGLARLFRRVRPFLT